jgi:hypothetical protein
MWKVWYALHCMAATLAWGVSPLSRSRGRTRIYDSSQPAVQAVEEELSEGTATTSCFAS